MSLRSIRIDPSILILATSSGIGFRHLSAVVLPQPDGADEGQDFALAQVVADVCQGAGLISSDVQVVHLDDRSRDRSVQVRTFHGAGHVGRR